MNLWPPELDSCVANSVWSSGCSPTVHEAEAAHTGATTTATFIVGVTALLPTVVAVLSLEQGWQEKKQRLAKERTCQQATCASLRDSI